MRHNSSFFFAVFCSGNSADKLRHPRSVAYSVELVLLNKHQISGGGESEPAYLVAHQRTQHSIVVRPTAVRAISTDIICQTIVQHCRTSDLELAATCRIKLRLSLYFQIQT